MKGPQHYIDHLKITFFVLLWCNSDVSFPILGYRYLNREKFSWAIGGGRGPPSKYAHGRLYYVFLRVTIAIKPSQSVIVAQISQFGEQSCEAMLYPFK